MRAVLCAIGLIAFTGCGSDDTTQTPSDYDHGTPVTVDTSTPPAPPFQQVLYPEGPYGTQEGSTVANLKFSGWKNPMSKNYDPLALETVQLSDFYNPNNDKPVKVLWVNSSAVWCGPCNQEYAYMKSEKPTDPSWSDPSTKGFMILGTLMEDAKSPPQPAKPSDLKNWAFKYEVEFPLVLDPGFKLGQFYPSDAFPSAFLIDTRTMKIIDKMVGGGAAGVQDMLQRIDTYLASNP